MLPTYPAVIRAGRYEWTGEVPPGLPADRSVRVQITFLEEPVAPAGQGPRMLAALKKLASSAAFAEITDPVAWQREQRMDRELPGRES